MITTTKEYKDIMYNGNRKFIGKATITFADSAVLNVNQEKISSNGIKFADKVSDTGAFSVGSAVINSCEIILDNRDDQFSKYDFTNAVIRPQVGLELSSTIEWLDKGVFTVDESKAVGSTIVLTALDNMNKFDIPFSNVSITFPCTELYLLQSVCAHCGVALTSVALLKNNYIIETRPADEAVTCREVLSWIAQNNGCFARCNKYGALELKWYDFGVFGTDLDGGTFDNDTPYSSGDSADGGDFSFSETTNYDGGTFADMARYHHIYSLQSATIGTDDIVITGIQAIVKETGESFLYGTEDYVLTIENPLIKEGDAELIATTVGQKIVGMRFRPLSISALSDPSIEAGDVAYVSDRKGNAYQTVITSLSYTIGSYESISCEAETVSKKQSVQYTPQEKAVAEVKAMVEKESTAREEAIEELNDIISQSGGLYYTVETLPNGSKINYMHDKPTLVASNIVWKMTADAMAVSTDGGVTYTAGITADGNAIVNRLNAHTVIGVRLEGSTLISQSPTNTTRRVEIADGLITVGDRSGTYAELDGGGLYFRSSSSSGTTIYNGYVGATAMQCQTLNNYAPITMGNYITYTQTAYIIQSDSVSAYLIAYSNASSGNLTGATAGYVKAYVAAQSDKRLKENIVELDNISEKYMQLNPISYNFKDGGGNDKRTNFGFLAQDIDKLFDRENYALVTEDHNPLEGQEQYCEDYVLTLNQNNLHAMHTKMIQSQQKEIESLKNELSELKKLLIEKGVI